MEKGIVFFDAIASNKIPKLSLGKTDGLKHTSYDFLDGTLWNSNKSWHSLWESTRPENGPLPLNDYRLNIDLHDWHFGLVNCL